MLLTLLFSFLFCPALSEIPDHYVWPDVFSGANGQLKFVVLGFDEDVINLSDSYCDDVAAPTVLEDSNTLNHATETGTVETYIVSMSMSECTGRTKLITFKVNGTPHKLRTKRGTKVSSNVLYGHSMTVTNCPSNNGFGYHVAPCLATNSRLCETAIICEGKLILTRPHAITENHEMNKTAFHGSKTCKFVFVDHADYTCRVSKQDYRTASERQFHGKMCSINSAKINGPKMLVRVPTTVGLHVCIDYEVFSGEREQQCTVAQVEMTEFSMPLNTWSVKITCDSSTVQAFRKEQKDIECPMFFPDSRFSKHICRDVYRPILFWTSMSWLILGLPLIWLITYLYYRIKCWFYIRKLWKESNVKCPNCGDIILSELDAVNHDECDNCKCPHCKKSCFCMPDLKTHVRTCPRREEIFEKTREIINWERTGYRCQNDASRVFHKRKFTASWILIFVLVFIAMFTPSLAGHGDRNWLRSHPHFCDHVNNCQQDRIMNIDNSHVPAKDSGNVPDSLDPEYEMVTRRPTVIEVAGSGTGDVESDKGLNGDDKKLLQVAKVILDSVETMKLEMSNILAHLKNELQNEIRKSTHELEASIRNKAAENIDNLKCKNFMKEFNMNIYLPEHLRQSSFNRLLIHKDNEEAMTHFGDAVLQIGGNNQHIGRSPSISAGPEAVVQIGRDFQQAHGGSGGGGQLGSGSNDQSRGIPSVDAATLISQSRVNRQEGSAFSQALFSMTKKTYRRKRSADLDADNLNLEILEAKKRYDENEEEFNRTVNDAVEVDFANRVNKVKRINGERNKVTITHVGRLETSIHKKKVSTPHLKWFDFHDITDRVCKVDCLHEPETCQCLDSKDKSETYALPWTTLQSKDIHFSNNPNSFKIAQTFVERSDPDHVYLKTSINAMMDLHEGSHLTWKLEHEESDVTPVLSIVIPRITQVYQSSFLYYTCEREITSEVKGLCTGGCGDYCKGRVCLGSTIWKWENCRKVWCNPSWCLSTNDGCCCCGSNVECPLNSDLASVWQMEYLRTEFIMCIFYNDRMQNCKLIDGTATFEFGEFTVGVSKVLSPDTKLPRTILALHKPINDDNTLHSHGNVIWEKPSEIYLDPPVCLGPQSCNHGSIGDLQIENITCLPLLGRSCYETAAELHATNCTKKVFMSNANTDMKMTCHSFHHHSCEHMHSVPKIRFENSLKQTEKMRERFYIKKLSMNLRESSMMLYPLPKSGVGAIEIEVNGKGIMVPKKDRPPVIAAAQILNCKGCYMCKMGFTCIAEIEIDSSESSMLTLKSENNLIDFNLSPIQVDKGINNVKVWGIAYGKASTAKACFKFGEKCLKEVKFNIELHEPVGHFIPVFNTLTATGSDPKALCSGFSWFSCAWESMMEFGADMWKNIYYFLYFLVGIAILTITILFLPTILTFIRALFESCCRRYKGRSGLMTKGKHVNDVYRSLSSKKTKYEKMKKTDERLPETYSLLIENDDFDFTA